MENKPHEARAVFLNASTNPDRAVAGEAFRGLAEVADFIGKSDEVPRYLFKAFVADANAALFSASLLRVSLYTRTAETAEIKEGERVLRTADRTPGLLFGFHKDQLASRYLNDGKTTAAGKLLAAMGIPGDWMFAGPFDNVSNNGYSTVYPPEKSIDLGAVYPGKDGNDAAWRRVSRSPYSAWLFVEDHCQASNAVNFFHASVTSDRQRDLWLGFGASGVYKVFLNNTVVLADSVYRNTGMDVFMQKVTLLKGGNSLLVKIGHEAEGPGGRLSNFAVHFLDDTYKPVTDLTFGVGAVKPARSQAPVADLSPTPVVDTVTAVLRSRLATQPNDVDAALLLMNFLNANEKTDEGQVLAREYVKRFPKSAAWHYLLAESLLRSKKYTEAQVEERNAFTLSPIHADAWACELSTVRESGDAKRILAFVDKAPPELQLSIAALLARLSAYTKLEKRNEALVCLSQLEREHHSNPQVLTVLASAYLEQGSADKAVRLIRSALKRQRSSEELYLLAAQVAIKKGDFGAAVRSLQECTRYVPVSAQSWSILANLHYVSKDLPRAEECVRTSLSIRPFDDDALNLLGNILIARGDKTGARQAYQAAIRFTSDDFNAWDNLRNLDGTGSLDSMAPLPEVDSLIAGAVRWKPAFTENGVILASIRDVFVYPSRCSREREFLVVQLPTQRAIDRWKEYSVDYNSRFQVPSLARAFTYKPDRTQVQADVNGNEIVFKSLQPGDYIVLEWSVRNYYFGDMARHVYGSWNFEGQYPVFDTRLRLITPPADTVPYQSYGDSIECSNAQVGDYRVASFRRGPFGTVPPETFIPADWPSCRKVNYSTFREWSEISRWYAGLSDRKKDITLELTALVDSLVAGSPGDEEKVRRIHHFITQNIRYSFVPFRQSGWIPQAAHDVLATRIGDCKDMASLGVTLLERAGIRAALVLVNTQAYGFIDHAYVGPDFNHCIAMYEVGPTRRFIDFTDNNGTPTQLPWGDQGAMALIIRPGENSVFALPLDSAARRVRSREITSRIDEKGSLNESVRSVRTGIYAAGFRDAYRHLSPESRSIDMHKLVADDYPAVTLNSFTIQDLDSLRDSVAYEYSYTAKGGVSITGTTAIFPLRLPDRIRNDEYPVEENRHFPIDMTRTNYGVSMQESHSTITCPTSWKLITVPTPVAHTSPYGTYRLEFSQSGNVITCLRTATFKFYRPLALDEFGAMKEFMDKVSKADAAQLVFFTE